MLIRNTLIVAGASFALAIGCFAGVAVIAGPQILNDGWTFPLNRTDTVVIRENGKVIHAERRFDARRGTVTPSIDRTLPWTGKDTLQIDVPVDVVFVQGPEAKIVASGPKSYLDRLRVDGGRIALSDADDRDEASVTISAFGVHVQSESERVKITVIAPDVTKFDVRGSGDLDIRRYDHPTFSVDVSGSGDVEAAGRVDLATIDNSGSGYVDLSDLKAKEAAVDVSGSGGGAIFATTKAKIAISGSGDVELRTEPKTVSSDITGSGEIRREY